MLEILGYLTPLEAWAELMNRRKDYYNTFSASYSGKFVDLRATGDPDSFWKRQGKGRIHVPLAADISATSADLLFGEEPRLTCYDEETEDAGSDKQKRLDFMISENDLFSKLSEGAESSAALGEVCFKIKWDLESLLCPSLAIVQADSCLPEYRFGVLKCIHFFTTLKTLASGTMYRLYERYERGRILSAVYKGDGSAIGNPEPETALLELGLISDMITPIDEMLAVHVPNMKPNRMFRDNERGRSDLEGLRSMMDALDEAYSSWLRDIRLAKSRIIVPAEYLRRKPSDMFTEGSYKYEFDEDVETLVALDIDTERAGTGITPSQFEIRSDEHLKICETLISSIVSMAGYAPQTFGINVEGNAQSGTALHIREKKSYNTRGKKEHYWRRPLEQLLSSLIRLDAMLYPGNKTDTNDSVKIVFSDTMSNDLPSMATSIEMLHRAAAISTEAKVNMIHPDWTGKQLAEEIDRVKTEFGFAMEPPNPAMGDFALIDKPKAELEEEEDQDKVSGKE